MPRKKIQRDRQHESASQQGAEVAPVSTGGEGGGPASATVPVVGIGASAGGLAAFEAFFTGIPADTDMGMAFVVVQHLAPDHPSMLAELIGRYTHLPVSDATDGMAVAPNGIYVIPPNADLAIYHGRLQLLELPASRPRLPIDHFLRSLAQDRQQAAIAIILSGAGSDGALGVRAVKEAGGLVMVQTPETAEYDSMPRSAIATGTADYVLPPGEMPAHLLAYVRHASARPAPDAASSSGTEDEALQKVLLLLRSYTHHDFADYKRSTVLRRIDRRMTIHQLDSLEAYARYVQDTPEELALLLRDLLIGVTRFFRDPEAFAALKTQVVPSLLDVRHSGGVVRIWVPGCATGEEAYSIAMLVHEAISARQVDAKLQIFATDIDAAAIETARAGAYPGNIVADVPSEYLARYFTQEDQSYRVRKVIRDLVVFAEQDIILDPPFSHMDLISCRNLLIYLNADLQKRLLPLFHYALNPSGFLFLGSSETVGDFSELFSTVNRPWKIYQRRSAVSPQRALPALPVSAGVGLGRSVARRDDQVDEPRGLRQLLEQNLAALYAPAAALINEKGDVLFVHGSTGRYLELATGEANLNIVRMARAGLRLELTMAIRKAAARKTAIRYNDVHVQEDGQTRLTNLLVSPLASPPAPGLLLVVFEDVANVPNPALPVAPLQAVSDKDRRIAELERELRTKDEYMQTHVEELTTANEELQSSNEELQSTTEEMDTSREELQSVNEELTTVNAELQKKIEELSQANDDMNNLLIGTDVGTVFVDSDGRVQRFTPSAGAIVNLIASDVGRPLAHITTNLQGVRDLSEDARQVFATLVPREDEVQSASGRWYFMRVLPYRTQDNAIAGVVFTFVDVSAQHALQERVQADELAAQAQHLAEDIVATVREPLLVLDADLRVVTANGAFHAMFGVNRGETVGSLLYDLGGGQWNIPELRQLLERVLPERTDVRDYTVTQISGRGGRRVLHLNARELRQRPGVERLILLAIDDVTPHSE